MRANQEVKKTSKLKDRFRILIDSLRERQNFRDKINSAAVELESSQKSQCNKQHTDIFPVTQNQNVDSKSQNTNDITSLNDVRSLRINNNSSFALIEDRQILQMGREKEQIVEGNEEEEHFGVIDNRINRLNPQVVIQCPYYQGRVGTIKNQVRSVNASFVPKNNQKQQEQKNKMPIKESYRQQLVSSQTQKNKVLIRQLNDIQMVKFWNSSPKLTQQMTYNEYHYFFNKMLECLSIKLQKPIIKKYKNCIYFGQNTQQNIQYQGILYYFDEKVYYGDFVNGIKHGHGVQINFRDNTKFAGNFNGGKKSGYFFVQKNEENYQGLLQHGLYHGQGKLITQDYIYTGCFEDGKKHGFGEQYHPKTGLKLLGYFKHDIYQHLNESHQPKLVASQPQLQNKVDKIITSSKSEMIDFKIDLATKLLRNRKNQSQQEFVIKNNQETGIGQVAFGTQDVGSLSDLLSNNKRVVKYDFDGSRMAKRLPKIYLEGIKKSQIYAESETNMVINRHSRALNQESNLKHRKHMSHDQKPIHFQPIHKQFQQIQSPLLKKPPKPYKP